MDGGHWQRWEGPRGAPLLDDGTRQPCSGAVIRLMQARQHAERILVQQQQRVRARLAVLGGPCAAMLAEHTASPAQSLEVEDAQAGMAVEFRAYKKMVLWQAVEALLGNMHGMGTDDTRGVDAAVADDVATDKPQTDAL